MVITAYRGGSHITCSLLGFPSTSFGFLLSPLRRPSALWTCTLSSLSLSMLSGKRANILVIHIITKQWKSYFFLKGLTLEKEIYTFKIIILATGKLKYLIWNSKQNQFPHSLAVPILIIERWLSVSTPIMKKNGCQFL